MSGDIIGDDGLTHETGHTMRKPTLSTLVATLATLALFSLAPAAHAATRTTRLAIPAVRPHVSPLAEAQAAAIQYWGGDPCGGNVTVTFATVLPDGSSGGVALSTIWAVTTFNGPAGFMDWNAPPASYTSCVITIARLWWPGWWRGADFPVFCALLVHEYGHLWGHADTATDSPQSITYPAITAQNEHVPAW